MPSFVQGQPASHVGTTTFGNPFGDKGQASRLRTVCMGGDAGEEFSPQERLRGVVPGSKPWNIIPVEYADQQPQELRWQEQKQAAGPKASGGRHVCSSHIITLSDYQLEGEACCQITSRRHRTAAVNIWKHKQLVKNLQKSTSAEHVVAVT